MKERGSLQNEVYPMKCLNRGIYVLGSRGSNQRLNAEVVTEDYSGEFEFFYLKMQNAPHK